MEGVASPVLPPVDGSGYRCGSRASGFAALVAGRARLFVAVTFALTFAFTLFIAVIFVALTAGIHVLLVCAALLAALAATATTAA